MSIFSTTNEGKKINMTFTAEEKFRCAAREWERRRRSYPQWVKECGMTQETADREIALMAEIADDYSERAKKEKML